jgi:uncharacterized membrane protein YbaN (DUF454 family)
LRVKPSVRESIQMTKFTRGNDVKSRSSKHKGTALGNLEAAGDASVRPDVDIDLKAQTIRVCDARLINAGQRAFCRRLLEAAARRQGIGKAEVDLAAASCRIEFAGRTASSQKMADFFADCVQEAASGYPDGEKKKRFGRTADGWQKMTAYPLASDVSLWETFDVALDRVKLRHRCPAGGDRQLPLLAEAIARLDDVERCEANHRSRSLAVDFCHTHKELNGFMDQAERSFEALLYEASAQRKADPDAAIGDAGGPGEIARGPKRVLYLGLAAGSFGMTLVALVVPGIPTVPFLLATSYFLARSSRWLDLKLRESVFFGSIVTEWEEHGGLGRRSKSKLMALSGVIVVIAIVLGPLSLVAVILLIVISSLCAYGVYRLPGLENERGSRVTFGTPRPALSGP